MAYGALVDRLEDDDTRRTVTTAPDGSIDRYCTISRGGTRIEDRETFGRTIARGGAGSFQIERDSREPAGQSVHMGLQADALGDDVTAIGYLEDPAFETVPFETVSIGSPAELTVFPLEDDDIIFSRRSPAFDDWSLETLRGAVPSLEGLLSADAICWGNWALLEGTTDVLARLPDTEENIGMDSDVFVCDPGPTGVRSRSEVRELLETLGDLEARTDVLYSVNRAELEYTADAIGANDSDEASDIDRLTAVREAAGITGAIVHAQDIAALVTSTDELVVPNLDVETVRRRTGAGDRFSGALAVGYARGWEPAAILALGNRCASYYVENGTTGDRRELLCHLEQTAPDEN